MKKSATSKNSKKPKAAKRESAKGGKVSRTSKLNVRETWVHILEENERAPRERKLTDAQILKHMQSEFPWRANLSRDFSVEAGVRAIRSAYNRGKFNEGKAPKGQSHRYNALGDRITSRGRTLNA